MLFGLLLVVCVHAKALVSHCERIFGLDVAKHVHVLGDKKGLGFVRLWLASSERYLCQCNRKFLFIYCMWSTKAIRDDATLPCRGCWTGETAFRRERSLHSWPASLQRPAPPLEPCICWRRLSMHGCWQSRVACAAVDQTSCEQECLQRWRETPRFLRSRSCDWLQAWSTRADHPCAAWTPSRSCSPRPGSIGGWGWGVKNKGK